MQPEPITILRQPSNDQTDIQEAHTSPLRDTKSSPSPANRHRVLKGSLSAVLLLVVGLGIGRALPVNDESSLASTAERIEDGSVYSYDAGVVATESTQHFVGVVHPGQSAALIAPFSGRITTLGEVVFGATVHVGDSIATIASVDAQYEMKQAELTAREANADYLKLRDWSNSSDVVQARRELETARQTFEDSKLRARRTKELLDEGIVAAFEYDTDLESLRSSEAAFTIASGVYNSVLEQGSSERVDLALKRFTLAQEQFLALKTAVEQQELTAPRSGILLPAPAEKDKASNGQRTLSIGQAVTKGEAVAIIGDLDEVQVRTFVSELDVNQVVVGQEASISSPIFGDIEVDGHIASISRYTADFQSADSPSGDMAPPVARYEVIITIPARELGIVDSIRVGMTVDIELAGDGASL